MKTLVIITLTLLVSFLGIVYWRNVVYEAYSRDFGSLTQVQFQNMNARMDQLLIVGRVTACALTASDLVLLVTAWRRRATAVLGFALLLALGLVFLWLIAFIAIGPAMIG